MAIRKQKRQWYSSSKKEDSELLASLLTDPRSEETQMKLKSFIAQAKNNEAVQEYLLEKITTLNKAMEQTVINESSVERQINIAHHSGNIIINNYATEKEKADDADTKLFDIKMLVASGDTKQAIEKLLQLTRLLGHSSLLNNSIGLASRFNRLEKDAIDGMISGADANVERARINKAALTYLDDLERVKR